MVNHFDQHRDDRVVLAVEFGSEISLDISMLNRELQPNLHFGGFALAPSRSPDGDEVVVIQECVNNL